MYEPACRTIINYTTICNLCTNCSDISAIANLFTGCYCTRPVDIARVERSAWVTFMCKPATHLIDIPVAGVIRSLLYVPVQVATSSITLAKAVTVQLAGLEATRWQFPGGVVVVLAVFQVVVNPTLLKRLLRLVVSPK
ncbi:MAG: hypothetical protein ABIX01_10695 [Chitinophagaceae bacterium]